MQLFYSTSALHSALQLLANSVGNILPELVLVVGLLVGIVLEITVGKRNKKVLPWVGFATLFAFGLTQLLVWPQDIPGTGFLGMIVPDQFAGFMKLLVAGGSLLAILAAIGSDRLKDHSKGMGEYYLVLIGMAVGMAFMTMASNLLMMYLSLELVSLPAYVLTAYSKMKNKGAEASLKYVIYGSFASGVMLYGISWLYGFTGTLDPASAQFAEGLAAAGIWPVTIMLTLVLSGFAYKIGAIPFHFWAPDVYEGAPHPVASLFSVAPKVAGFAMLIRFLAMLPLESQPELFEQVRWILGLMAIASMFLGNLAAIRQDNFRRMLAYSSIAQIGYILAGAMFVDAGGYAVVMFYLCIYLLMNMSAFLLAGWMEEKMGIVKIKEMKGLATGLPIAAVIASVAMVSLTGLPPTGGFIAKLRLVLAGVESYQGTGNVLIVVLLIAVLVNTVISLFYYLRVPSTMIFGNPLVKTSPRFRGLVPVLLVIMCIATIWLGIFSFDRLVNFLSSLPPYLHS